MIPKMLLLVTILLLITEDPVGLTDSFLYKQTLVNLLVICVGIALLTIFSLLKIRINIQSAIMRILLVTIMQSVLEPLITIIMQNRSILLHHSQLTRTLEREK